MGTLGLAGHCPTKTRVGRIAFVWVLALALWCAVAPRASASRACGPVLAQEEQPSETNVDAALVVWNREVAVFRVDFEGRGPADRARRAARRILTTPAEGGVWQVARATTNFEGATAFVFTVNGEFAFRLLPGDEDAEAGETLEQVAVGAEARLREALDSRALQSNWRLQLQGVSVTVVATLAFLAALVGILRLRTFVRERVARRWASLRAPAAIGGVDLWPLLGGVRNVVARLAVWGLIGAVTYLWALTVLEQFPYTRPWGDALGGFLLEVLARLGWGILSSLPDLLVVALIAALAQAFNHGVAAYFRPFETGERTISWLTPESARASRLIAALLVWVFALVVAYPYIPGSESAAFKGVSVFLGLMVSLGSAGFANQVMSGLMVVYARAFRRGDYVRIGEKEGRVVELGLLATTLEGTGGLRVAIPNGVVTTNTITNFTREGRDAAELLVTSVTIGYDVPWRQVHGLLLLAAQRTSDLRAEPAPFVVQRALSDFYVEYQLHVQLAQREQRHAALTRLHAAIQDAFNEHGVQILSPHFEAQPARPVVVPRASWFTPPARDVVPPLGADPGTAGSPTAG